MQPVTGLFIMITNMTFFLIFVSLIYILYLLFSYIIKYLILRFIIIKIFISIKIDRFLSKYSLNLTILSYICLLISYIINILINNCSLVDLSSITLNLSNNDSFLGINIKLIMEEFPLSKLWSTFLYLLNPKEAGLHISEMWKVLSEPDLHTVNGDYPVESIDYNNTNNSIPTIHGMKVDSLLNPEPENQEPSNLGQSSTSQSNPEQSSSSQFNPVQNTPDSNQSSANLRRYRSIRPNPAPINILPSIPEESDSLESNPQQPNLVQPSSSESNPEQSSLSLFNIERPNSPNYSQRSASWRGYPLTRPNSPPTNILPSNLSEASSLQSNQEIARLAMANLEKSNPERNNLWQPNTGQASSSQFNPRQNNTLEYNSVQNSSLESSIVQNSNLQSKPVRPNLPIFTARRPSLFQSETGEFRLPPLNVERPNLLQTNVEHINMSQTNIQQINMPQTNIQQINVPQTNIEHINVPQTNVEQIHIPQTLVGRANVSQINIERANLRELPQTITNLEDQNQIQPRRRTNLEEQNLIQPQNTTRNNNPVSDPLVDKLERQLAEKTTFGVPAPAEGFNMLSPAWKISETLTHEDRFEMVRRFNRCEKANHIVVDYDEYGIPFLKNTRGSNPGPCSASNMIIKIMKQCR